MLDRVHKSAWTGSEQSAATGTSQWERCMGRAAVRSDFRLSFQLVWHGLFGSKPVQDRCDVNKIHWLTRTTPPVHARYWCEPVVFVHVKAVQASITAGFTCLDMKRGHAPQNSWEGAHGAVGVTTPDREKACRQSGKRVQTSFVLS